MNGNTGTMNLVMTILGFAMSATFVIFVCARLLCVRIRQRHVRSRSSLEPTPEDLERSLNGMDAVVVASLPTLKYSQGVFASKDDALCTVCLGEYEDKEVLRLLPRCGHAFHLDCIDAWLRQHSTCPICRISLRTGDVRGMPSPLMNRAAMTRFSPGALPDSMFEQLQQQPQWSEARRSGLSSPTRATDTDRSVSYGQNLPSRWRSNEAAEILWHMSRRQYPIDLESAMRVEEDVLRSRQEEGTRVSTADSPASGEIYFLGQRREIRYPRSGKWSVWLWRRWERGEPGSSPLTQEHPSEWPSTSSSPAAAPVRLYSPSSFNLRHNAAYADEGSAAAQTSGSSLDHLAIPVAQVATAVPVSTSEIFTGVDEVEQGITERRPSQQEISEERPTQRQKSVTRSQITLQGVSPGEEVADKIGR